MNVRALIKASSLILGAAALIGASGCVAYSYLMQWQAESCLKTILQLDVGSSTQVDALKAMKPFRRFEIVGTASFGGGNHPNYAYWITNNGFHLLGIFYPSRFSANLIFRDGIVVWRSAAFVQEPYHVVGTRETITGLLQDISLNENPTGMMVSVWDPPSRMDVDLDARASEADRKAAYDYNLGCFTSVFGCRSVYKILPGVKKPDAK
jgi:hypothetical protein